MTAGSPGPHRYEITATDTTTSTVLGEAWACKDCLSIEWPGLVVGHSYSFAITRVNTAEEVSAAATTTASVPSGPCVGATDACVAVDATDIGDPNRFVASGILHGLASSTSPDYATFVQPLNLQQWRTDAGPPTGANTASWPYMATNSFDPSTTVIVSDRWDQDALTRVNCANLVVRQNPWDNWGFYGTWLTNLVNNEKAAGRDPDYWDLLNEVDARWQHPFHSTLYDGAGTRATQAALAQLLCPDEITPAKIFDYLFSSYQIIHGLGEKVIAPSPPRWDDAIAIGPAGLKVIDLDDLLVRSTNGNIVWDGFSYHELNPGKAQNVIIHALQARALIGNHPIQDDAGLFINEYSSGASPLSLLTPGRMAAMFWGLTLADPVEANYSCFGDPGNPGPSNCFNGSLGGLLDIDGGGVPHQRSAWYAMQAYGQLAGDLIDAGTTDGTMTATAAYDADGDAVRMLVGRSEYGVTTRVDLDTVLRVVTPVAFGTDVTFTFGAIANSGLDPASSAPTVTACDTTVNGSGVAEAPIADFPDNDAYLVTVTPANPGAPNSAC